MNKKFPTMPRPHTNIIIGLQNYSANKRKGDNKLNKCLYLKPNTSQVMIL